MSDARALDQLPHPCCYCGSTSKLHACTGEEATAKPCIRAGQCDMIQCIGYQYDETSRKLWSGIRVYCNGAYHRTKYVGKTEKDGTVTVSMELIKEEPEEGGFKGRIAKILEIPDDKMGKSFRLQDIFYVIDEADRDFPRWNDEKYRCRGGGFAFRRDLEKWCARWLEGRISVKEP